MKYLLTILGLALASARALAASAQSNDDFAKASVATVTSSSISAGALAEGVTYIITSIGTTDFTTVGADENLVGTVFVATGPATGSGGVGSVTTITGSNVDSSSEIAEPVHAGVGAGNSVWWAWTPTKSGTATIDTNGSSFDTVLAVYRGGNLATLTELAHDDDVSATNVTSKVSFTVVQGTTYYIAVDGFNGGARGATGSITLHVVVGPGTYNAQNDDYADRAVITGEYAVVTGSSELATIEPGENSILYYYYSVNSVWWTWKAPRAGKVTISAEMLMNPGFGWINFYGELALFSGSGGDDVTQLLYLQADEGGSGTVSTASTPSLVRTVTEGEVLQIRVADYVTPGGAQITLKVSMDAADLTNDHFAKRALLSGTSASASISNSLATDQAGEPAHYEEVAAVGMVPGKRYMINSVGTTDFMLNNAGSNALGTEFTANSVAGSGTGTVLRLKPMALQSPVIYSADKIEAGKTYVIYQKGSTNFYAIGASIFYDVGTIFTATAAGTGTGKVYLYSGLLTVGKTYRIESTGDTDFTLLGATLGAVDEVFTATATGYGTGTVLPVDVITAGSFVVGRNYRIESVGTTDFVALGAAANVVGTTFQAIGVGSGTGTASTPSASKSAWWTWVAPANGYVSLNTSTSEIDTVVKVYSTSGVSSPTLADLIPVAGNDDVTGTNTSSFVHCQVVKGTSYQIAVDSAGLYRESGNITLGLSFIPDVPAITVQVQNQTASVVGGPTAAFTVSNTGAAAIYDWQVKTPGSTTWVHVDDGVTTDPVLANATATSTLALASVTRIMNGNQYRCVITNIAGQVTSKSATLTVIYLTTYQGGTPANVDLGVEFPVAPLGATSVTYYASGLPAGLTINSGTGVVSGRITAKPNTNYTIKYWTTYVLAGEKTKTAVQNTVILINPCPASMTGNFEGLLLNGSPAVPSGKLSLTVNSSGAFTGKLMYNGVVYSIRSALLLDSVTYPTQGSVTLTPKPTSTLSLTIIVKTASTMTATLTDGVDVVGTIAGTDGVQLKTYSAAIPAPWAGTYTLAFTDPTYTAPDSGPEGSGYAFVTINNRGLLTLKGKLADGTRVTASLSTDASLTGQYRPYVPLYSNKLGFLSGWLPLSVRGVNTGRYHIATGTGLDVYWVKPGITNDKSYPDGFGPVGLNVVMEPWITPTRSFLVGPLGLLTSDSQTIGNFGLKLLQTGGVENTVANTEVLPTSLKMDALSKVSVLDATNPRGFTVKITPKTGFYSGSFTLADSRKVKFEGVLLQLLNPVTGDVFGHGFFLVPPLATPPGGSILSGDVQFTIPTP